MHASLPNWNLNDLYPAPDSAELADDQHRLRDSIEKFVEEHRGKVTGLDAASLVAAIRAYEVIEDGLGKIASYADLLFSTDTTNMEIAATYQNLQEYVQARASELVFFTLELNHMEEAVLEALLEQHAPLRHYQPWLRDVRAFRAYQLDEQLEQLLLDKSSAANQAWIRLYEDVSNRMQVPVGEEALTLTEALDRLSHKEGATRKQAALGVSQALSERAEQFALIYNVVMKDKAVDDKWRGFTHPVASRNLANLVEDEIVDTLAATVKDNYANLAHRYYRIKANMLGKEVLEYWDRGAPLPGDDDSDIPWEEAKQIVLEAYAGFSPEMADIAQRFFDENWIDVPVKEGKTSGAFSHPTVPSAHPYILLNYQGKLRDVMTLAHELGHGVHQVLSAQQGALMADTPLTLAETASVFGEQLTFQYLLNREQDAAKCTRLIAGKVEDMLGTVVRQIAFYEFETRLHAARAEGEVSLDAVNKHWMAVQSESLGPAFRFDESYRVYWMYVSHFFHTPFYVYAYAFGDCLVNSLYAVYEQEKAAGGSAAFETRYLEMLRAGGSKRHKALLAPFGIDIAQPDFWQQGLDVIAGYVDALEG